MEQQRPYQGYPYTNPHVTDAPSVDAATANRWAHLPRKPLDVRTVVYVDMPEEGGSQVTRNESGEAPHPDAHNKKSDIDDNPVIYIDVPESGGSSVAARAEPLAQPEPEYVQDTIFYNPFDNRRIDQHKEVENGTSSDSESGSSEVHRPPLRPAPGRPEPPNTLNLNSPGSSSGYSSPPGLPASLSKETLVYGRQQTTSDDDFLRSPIPVSEFPEPPPAYTEIESPTRLVESPASAVTPTELPPRTVVITQGSDLTHRNHEPSPLGLPNPHRKVVYCQHCGHRVHTLVIRQTGTWTHVIALTLLCIGLFPVTIAVYATDAFKNKNHYCPNCNKMIGFEVPVLCDNWTYTNSE